MSDSRKAAEQAYGAVCAHGQLARSCNICELERERDSWKAKAEANERDASLLHAMLLRFGAECDMTTGTTEKHDILLRLRIEPSEETYRANGTLDFAASIRNVLEAELRIQSEAARSAEKEKE